MDGTSEGKRQTAEQAAALAKKTVEQNEFQHGLIIATTPRWLG
jgi:hypothetical protein